MKQMWCQICLVCHLHSWLITRKVSEHLVVILQQKNGTICTIDTAQPVEPRQCQAPLAAMSDVSYSTLFYVDWMALSVCFSFANWETFLPLNSTLFNSLTIKNCRHVFMINDNSNKSKIAVYLFCNIVLVSCQNVHYLRSIFEILWYPKRQWKNEIKNWLGVNDFDHFVP